MIAPEGRTTLGFKGERFGRFVLARKIGPALEGEIWKARPEAPSPKSPPSEARSGGEPPGTAPAEPRPIGGTEPAAAIRLFYDSEWAQAFRATGVPRAPEHANVCRILEATPDAPVPFLAREYVEGTSLRDLLAERRYLPLSAALPTALQLARAVGAYHKAGLAHNDLRPANILLDGKGALKIADGMTEGYRKAVVARLMDKGRPLPPERAQAYLPYLPPEQRRGEVLGPAADMYALGVILFEILTGERPEGFEVRMPSQRDKRIPKVLDEASLPALERTPRARTPNALGLAERLLEGISKAGFVIDPKGDPISWVKGTPWKADTRGGVGDETGRFQSDLTRLAREDLTR